MRETTHTLVTLYFFLFTELTKLFLPQNVYIYCISSAKNPLFYISKPFFFLILGTAQKSTLQKGFAWLPYKVET